MKPFFLMSGVGASVLSVTKKKTAREQSFFSLWSMGLLHRLHAADDIAYFIAEVFIKLTIILLHAAWFGMACASQKIILQAEDVCQYFISLGGICFLYLFQYDALQEKVACYVVDSFL